MDKATTTSACSKLTIVVALLSCWCTPLRDLDRAASGRGGSSGGAVGLGSGGTQKGTGGAAGADKSDASIATGGTGVADGATGAGGATTTGGATATGGTAATGGATATDAAMATGGTAATGGATATGGGLTTGGVVGTGGTRDAGSSGGLGGTLTGTGGKSTATGGSSGGGGTSTVDGAAGTTGLVAPDLPDIYDSPVQGDITYSAGASWDIDGAQWPAFEIHTPTASYWLVKSAAAIVSINDTSGLQWINFSSGFRPNRGVPNLGGCCQPGDPAKLGLPTMTTEIDPLFTVTSNHLRLISKSDDGSYWLVWDFFQTHFTLTINRAAKAFGFTYRGVPGGAFGSADQLVLSSGTMRSATLSYSGDLPGPSEWAYFSHPVVQQSLFLIQHSDDTLPDTYQIADGDSAMFVFGGGKITQTPIRFSLGLVNSCDDQVVRDRITFVQNAIQ